MKDKLILFLVQRRKDEGFTIVELLTVLIIIGILSAIALPSFLNQANKARESEAASNIGAVNRAQQAYFVENSAFGSNLEALDLGIRNTQNYTYEVTPAETEALAEASPAGQLKGYAGRVWISPVENGNVTKSILCAGRATKVPELAGQVSCPGEAPITPPEQ